MTTTGGTKPSVFEILPRAPVRIWDRRERGPIGGLRGPIADHPPPAQNGPPGRFAERSSGARQDAGKCPPSFNDVELMDDDSTFVLTLERAKRLILLKSLEINPTRRPEDVGNSLGRASRPGI
jgi:hypothetical protein